VAKDKVLPYVVGLGALGALAYFLFGKKAAAAELPLLPELEDPQAAADAAAAAARSSSSSSASSTDTSQDAQAANPSLVKVDIPGLVKRPTKYVDPWARPRFVPPAILPVRPGIRLPGVGPVVKPTVKPTLRTDPGFTRGGARGGGRVDQFQPDQRPSQRPTPIVDDFTRRPPQAPARTPFNPLPAPVIRPPLSPDFGSRSLPAAPTGSRTPVRPGISVSSQTMATVAASSRPAQVSVADQARTIITATRAQDSLNTLATPQAQRDAERKKREAEAEAKKKRDDDALRAIAQVRRQVLNKGPRR